MSSLPSRAGAGGEGYRKTNEVISRYLKEDALLERLIEKAIQRSGTIDTESLCMVASDKCG
jgi:exosome complex RNA-binding protein Rrp42 (RNase PH superfamily)